MSRVADLEQVLDPSGLGLPESPRVVRVEVQEDIDSTGDPALFIWVLLDDQTSDDEQTWQQVQPIESAIIAKLRETGEERWPYVRFRTESEHREFGSS